jgi:hypothetical protein
VFENAAGFLRVRGATREDYDDELDGRSDYYSGGGGGRGGKGRGGQQHKVGGGEEGRRGGGEEGRRRGMLCLLLLLLFREGKHVHVC